MAPGFYHFNKSSKIAHLADIILQSLIYISLQIYLIIIIITEIIIYMDKYISYFMVDIGVHIR